LNSLAELYSNRGDEIKAVKYYSLAVQKGNADALHNLAGLYYNSNKNKQEALELINRYNEISSENQAAEKKILVEIWNDIFVDTEIRIRTILNMNPDGDFTGFLENLLFLQQQNLVLRLFENNENGKVLQDRFKLLYYAVLLLTNTSDELILRIPPEVMPTVLQIVESVKNGQKFYTEK
jgi:tetratricopeptide (TPR) repeat protein